MDCSMARLFTLLEQPGREELASDERRALEQHLAECESCRQLVVDEERLDRQIARSMTAVEVPQGLKKQIFLRLSTERGKKQRRWGATMARVGAVAAGIALLIGAWRLFYAPARPVIGADDILIGGNLTRAGSDEKANHQLQLLHTFPGAPAFLNYAFLKGGASLAILPGTESWKSPIEAPQMVFVDGPREAFVYSLPQDKFQVEDLDNSAHGYKYNLDILRPEPGSSNDRYVYLILYTGDNWTSWLKTAEEP